MLRIGIGHDTHRLADGGPLRLGGVTIPFERHLVGHSDADVLLHAVTDALLGAAALGDIGEQFPDTDAVNRGRDSADMLRRACELVRARGYQIGNLDCIVFAQRPKLSPFKEVIRASIAAILGIDALQVGVKAKTGELVGPVGREEALMAECVALLTTEPPATTASVDASSSSAPTNSRPGGVPAAAPVSVPASVSQTSWANRTMSTISSSIRVYNTLTKLKEPLETVQPGHVGIYLCGPTVYKPAHIGHMVGPVIFDTIKRYLVHCGYQVTWVVNITDVDDKLIAQSRERGIPMSQVATEMTMDYMANLKSLGVDQIDHMPKATEHIDEIIKFIGELIERGFAYASGGDVFFDVAADPGYGKLSNRSADDQQGEGGGAASKKRSPGDFALWKSAKPGEPAWDSPWGAGRPGWHIECSAMSRRLLGKTFDIHGGGLDLVFPHHENEVAQSECCHGQPMVKYWLHNGLMRAGTAGKVGGRADRAEGAAEPVEAATVDTKISRSKGAGGLADLIARQGGEKLRFFLLRTHYRSTAVFGEEEVAEAGVGLETFWRFIERFQRVTGTSFYELKAAMRRTDGDFDPAGDALLVEVKQRRDAYLAHMDDDFNTGAAISELFELVRALNKFVDQHQLEEKGAAQPQLVATFVRAATVLRELGAILGLFRAPVAKANGAGQAELVEKLMALIIELRADARVKKDFATADKIRQALTQHGVTLEDRKGVTHWRADKQ